MEFKHTDHRDTFGVDLNAFRRARPALAAVGSFFWALSGSKGLASAARSMALAGAPGGRVVLAGSVRKKHAD